MGYVESNFELAQPKEVRDLRGALREIRSTRSTIRHGMTPNMSEFTVGICVDYFDTIVQVLEDRLTELVGEDNDEQEAA